MTTVYAEVNVMPKPGTIIFIQGSSRMTDSHFGLTTSLDFFNENATGRALESFFNLSQNLDRDMLIPIMVMMEDFSWGLRYCQRHHSTQFDSLLDKEDDLNKCLIRIKCFTHRDGSRYYAEFFRHVLYYLDFLSGKEKLDDYGYMKVENPLEKKYVEHLIRWRDEQMKGFFACTPS